MNYSLGEQTPEFGDDVFIAPSADVIGDVSVGQLSSLWFNVVARGDVENIEIGEETNIQDQAILHSREGMPLTIGSRVTVGHGVCVHGCTIESETLIGIGAKVLDGATVRKHSMVGAGAVVTPETEVPPGAVYMGAPAQLSRNLREGELDMILKSAQMYVQHSKEYQEHLTEYAT